MAQPNNGATTTTMQPVTSAGGLPAMPLPAALAPARAPSPQPPLPGVGDGPPPGEPPVAATEGGAQQTTSPGAVPPAAPAQDPRTAWLAGERARITERKRAREEALRAARRGMAGDDGGGGPNIEALVERALQARLAAMGLTGEPPASGAGYPAGYPVPAMSRAPAAAGPAAAGAWDPFDPAQVDTRVAAMLEARLRETTGGYDARLKQLRDDHARELGTMRLDNEVRSTMAWAESQIRERELTHLNAHDVREIGGMLARARYAGRQVTRDDVMNALEERHDLNLEAHLKFLEDAERRQAEAASASIASQPGGGGGKPRAAPVTFDDWGTAMEQEYGPQSRTLPEGW